MIGKEVKMSFMNRDEYVDVIIDDINEDSIVIYLDNEHLLQLIKMIAKEYVMREIE